MKIGFSTALTTLALTLASTASLGADVTNFSVRGVMPGMPIQEACNKLSGSFSDERSMKDKLNIARTDRNYRLNVDDQIHMNGGTHYGCRGGYKLYDSKLDGAMIRHDSIEVEQEADHVYFVSNMQSLKVGDKLSDCTSRREKMVESLISKYGKPKHNRTGERNGETYKHLIWDYSKEPNLRRGDTGLEEYQAYFQCELYTHGTEFGLLKVQTQVHSGKAILNARKNVKSDKSFEAEL